MLNIARATKLPSDLSTVYVPMDVVSIGALPTPERKMHRLPIQEVVRRILFFLRQLHQIYKQHNGDIYATILLIATLLWRVLFGGIGI